MAITGVRDIADCEIEGRSRTYNFRKTPSQASVIGLWFDLSMSPGNPVPKYWFDAPPLKGKQVSQSVDGGFFHGANTSPAQQYLRKITVNATAATALPMNLILCDYLLYYPSIDDGTTGEQTMDVASQTLPRYTDGDGVMMVAITTAARTGGQSFTVNYTNSDGVAGRTSSTVTQNTTGIVGTVTTSNRASSVSDGNPFIGLQSGDSGVRSIEGVTMNGTDFGLFSIVLVKPIAQITIPSITAPYEKDFYINSQELPKIEDDAYLNFLSLPLGSLAATAVIGDLKVIWK